MTTLLIQLLLVLIIGFAVGLERQKKHRVIGVRSTTLVLLGAFVFAYISTMVGGDPARIIGQVCAGVGFVGAGLIFKNGANDIQNLTTAILVWTLSAVGCLIALNFLAEAIIITVVIMIILQGYEFITNKINKNEN